MVYTYVCRYSLKTMRQYSHTLYPQARSFRVFAIYSEEFIFRLIIIIIINKKDLRHSALTTKEMLGNNQI